MPSDLFPSKRALHRSQLVRHVRDIVRSELAHGFYDDQRLPSEAELMKLFLAPRSVVREALALLRSEGLVERLQGFGTFPVDPAVVSPVPESLPDSSAARRGIWSGEIKPTVLARRIVKAPALVKQRLRTDDELCLQFDYVAEFRGHPIALVTDYIRYPEAKMLDDVPFRVDFYTLMEDAGLSVGATESLIGCMNADQLVADLLHVPVGSAVLSQDQLVYTGAGEPFVVGFVWSRADRFLLQTWSTRLDVQPEITRGVVTQR